MTAMRSGLEDGGSWCASIAAPQPLLAIRAEGTRCGLLRLRLAYRQPGAHARREITADAIYIERGSHVLGRDVCAGQRAGTAGTRVGTAVSAGTRGPMITIAGMLSTDMVTGTSQPPGPSRK